MPRFIYLVDETQPWLPAQIDMGANRDRLVAFKKGLLKGHICKQFASRNQLKWSPMWVVSLPCNPLPKEGQEFRPMPLPSALTEMIQKLKRSGWIEADDLRYLERIADRWIKIGEEDLRKGRR